MNRLLLALLLLSQVLFGVTYETIAKVNVAGNSDLTGTPTTTISTSAPIATGSGNCILVYLSWNDNSVHPTTATITDTAGNTYVLVDSAASTDLATRMSSYVTWNTIAHASNTITATTSTNANAPLISVIQYSGVKRDGNPADAHGGDFVPFANSYTSGAFTTTQTNEVLTSAVRTVAGSLTAGSGYSIQQLDSSGFHAIEDQLVTTIQTSVTASMTGAANSSWVTGVVTLKAAVSAGAGPKVRVAFE
jgi:hypothetical protein